MILSAQSIRKHHPVMPLLERTKYKGCSYGLSSAGYDIRIAQSVTLCPDEFVLASSIERFNMNWQLLGIVHDKSTWARRGIALQNTVIEPGWEGYLTMEITNHGSSIVYIPKGVGIAQIIFHLLDEPTVQPYHGKYQNQEYGPQEAILEP